MTAFITFEEKTQFPITLVPSIYSVRDVHFSAISGGVIVERHHANSK